jgi:hypothetical protein
MVNRRPFMAGMSSLAVSFELLGLTETAFRNMNIVFPYVTPSLDVGMTLLSANNLRHCSVGGA